MTVSTEINKVSYIGNGVAASFAIPFPFLEKEHLKVRQLLNDVQTERTDWTVSGGNMVFETAPADGAQILIMREVPLTQETDYRENEILPAETLERNFDKLTMQVQQLKEQADRAVTVDIFDDTDATGLIPSIRQAVSDCASYMTIAEQKAEIASNKAELATQKAQIASDKAAETVNTLSGKAEKDLSNLTVTGKKNLFSMLQPKGSSLVNIFEAYITSVQQTFSAPANGELFLLISKEASNTVSLYKNNVLVDIFGEASTMMTIFSFKDIAEKDDVYSIATDQSSVGITLSRFTFLAGEN